MHSIYQNVFCRKNNIELLSYFREAAKKSYFLNGSAIKALTPPPNSSLIAVGTLAVGKKMSLMLPILCLGFIEKVCQ